MPPTKIDGLPGKRIAAELWDLDEAKGDPATGTLFGVFRSPNPEEFARAQELEDRIENRIGGEDLRAILKDEIGAFVSGLMVGAYIENGAGKVQVDNWREGADASRMFQGFDALLLMRRVCFPAVTPDARRFFDEVIRSQSRRGGTGEAEKLQPSGDAEAVDV